MLYLRRIRSHRLKQSTKFGTIRRHEESKVSTGQPPRRTLGHCVLAAVSLSRICALQSSLLVSHRPQPEQAYRILALKSTRSCYLTRLLH